MATEAIETEEDIAKRLADEAIRKAEMDKWNEEKEAKWKAEEPARLARQAQVLKELAGPSLVEQVEALQAAVKVLQDKLGVTNV